MHTEVVLATPVNEIMVTKLSDGPDLFDLKLTKHQFDGIPEYVINLLI